MQSTWRVVVLFAVLLGISATQVLAVNPADPTSSFRFGTDFVKIAFDNVGSDASFNWVFAQKELGGRTAVLIYNEYDTGGKALYELAVTKQVAAGSGTLEVALFADLWHGDSDDSGLMLDWSNKKVGVGTVIRAEGYSEFEARLKPAPNTTVYLSLAESGGHSPRWGIGQKVGKVQVDIATDGDTTWLRACQPVGKNFFPELRTKFTKDESFVGFGLGFAP